MNLKQKQDKLNVVRCIKLYNQWKSRTRHGVGDSYTPGEAWVSLYNAMSSEAQDAFDNRRKH